MYARHPRLPVSCYVRVLPSIRQEVLQARQPSKRQTGRHPCLREDLCLVTIYGHMTRDGRSGSFQPRPFRVSCEQEEKTADSGGFELVQVRPSRRRDRPGLVGGLRWWAMSWAPPRQHPLKHGRGAGTIKPASRFAQKLPSYMAGAGIHPISLLAAELAWAGWRPLASTAPGTLVSGYWRAVFSVGRLPGIGSGRIEESRTFRGVNAPMASNMAFFWNRPFFHRSPDERGPVTIAVDVRSASAPAAISASHRHPSNSNQWAMIMLFGTIAALYLAREILIPLAFALILAFALNPVVELLQRSRIGRLPSVVVAVLVTTVAAGCVGWIIAIQLVDVAKELPRYRQNIHAKMEALRLPAKGPLGLAANSLREIARELSSPVAPSPDQDPPVQNRMQRTGPSTPGPPLPVQIVEQPAEGLEYLRDFVQPVLRPVGLTGLALIFTVFLLIKRFDLRHRLFRLVGLGQINIMTQMLDDAAQRVSRYLLIQVLVNAGFGVLFGFGLYCIGCPVPRCGESSPASFAWCRMSARWLPARCQSHSRWQHLIVGCRRCWYLYCLPVSNCSLPTSSSRGSTV
jgi:predicted PurR-regulated permease PerM